MTELKSSQRVDDVLIALVDGLAGFPEGDHHGLSARRRSDTAAVHLVRSSLELCELERPQTSWRPPCGRFIGRPPKARRSPRWPPSRPARGAPGTRRSGRCGGATGRMRPVFAYPPEIRETPLYDQCDREPAHATAANWSRPAATFRPTRPPIKLLYLKAAKHPGQMEDGVPGVAPRDASPRRALRRALYHRALIPVLRPRTQCNGQAPQGGRRRNERRGESRHFPSSLICRTSPLALPARPSPSFI